MTHDISSNPTQKLWPTEGLRTKVVCNFQPNTLKLKRHCFFPVNYTRVGYSYLLTSPHLLHLDFMTERSPVGYSVLDNHATRSQQSVKPQIISNHARPCIWWSKNETIAQDYIRNGDSSCESWNDLKLLSAHLKLGIPPWISLWVRGWSASKTQTGRPQLS